MKKWLVSKPDGRVIVKKSPVPKPLVPKGFVIVLAYGEKCLSGPADDEISFNMWRLKAVANNLDTCAVCMFIPESVFDAIQEPRR